MTAGVLCILLFAFLYGVTRLPSSEARVGVLGELAGIASSTTVAGGNSSSGASLLPFTVASLSMAFGIPAEFPEAASGGAIIASRTTPVASTTGVAAASETSFERPAATQTASVTVVATRTAVVASASVVASSTVKPRGPAKASETAVIPPKKPKLPDLEALGYRLHGIIHRQFGRSSAFIFDPIRGKEVVVTAGASDPIKLLEVSDRQIVIQTPKGTGTLKLGESGPPASRPGALPQGAPFGAANAVAGSGSGSSSAILLNASDSQPFKPTSAVSSVASGTSRPLSVDDSYQLVKSGALTGKEEGGRWYAVVGKVASDSPLFKAGFKEGDKIETVGQTGFSHGAQIPSILDRWGSGENESRITVIRNGSVIRWKAGEAPPETGPAFVPQRPPVSDHAPSEPPKPFGTVPPPILAPSLPPGVIPAFGGPNPQGRPPIPQPTKGYGQQDAH